MKPIALVSALNTNKHGGVPVYVAHLAKAFRAQGYSPQIMRISKRTSRTMRAFTNGESVSYMAPADLVKTANSVPTILCTPTTGETGIGAHEAVSGLGLRGAPVVIHDPLDFYPEVIAACKKHGIKVITIRKKVREDLIALGLKPSKVTFIQHPYVSIQAKTTQLKQREYRAVYVTRICFRKNTPLVALANELVPDSSKVNFWGALNRVCARHKLDKDTPNWRHYYHGPFPTGPASAFNLLAQGRLAIDLTVIPQDGEGTQYSFLEAWDAGTPLIVHRDWVLDGKGTCREGENVLAVSTPKELAAILASKKEYPELARNAVKILDHHGPSQVIPQYEAVMGL